MKTCVSGGWTRSDLRSLYDWLRKPQRASGIGESSTLIVENGGISDGPL